MRKSLAILVIVTACLAGALTIVVMFQLAWDVAHHPSPGVTTDAISLLPLFGVPVIVVVLLAVIGRALLRSSKDSR